MTEKKVSKKKEKWTFEHTLGVLGIVAGVYVFGALLSNPEWIAGLVLIGLFFVPSCRASYWEGLPEERASNYDDPYHTD